MAGDKRVSASPKTITLHASCVAIAGRGLLVLGASGSGKSGLALSLMALGAELVADDRVVLQRGHDAVTAHAPETIAGLIEARGIGLLNTPVCGPVTLSCVVDLDRDEVARMPPPRETLVLDVSLPLLFRVDAPHFPAALMLFMTKGRRADP